MSREAIEDRRQRAREVYRDVASSADKRHSRIAFDVAIETATRVKITDEAIEAFGVAWHDAIARSGGDRRRAGLAAALAELGFEVEE